MFWMMIAVLVFSIINFIFLLTIVSVAAKIVAQMERTEAKVDELYSKIENMEADFGQKFISIKDALSSF